MKIGSLIKNHKFFALSLFLNIVFIISCNTSDEPEVFTFNGNTMGTTYSIKVCCAKSDLIENQIQFQIDSILVDLNNKMSTYINDSEISLFNKSSDTGWVNISNDFAQTVYDAIIIGKESENYYDVTIGPVVNLWGFGPEPNLVKIPSDAEIKSAKDKTGIENLEVDLINSKIKKHIPELYLDLSSIAKGFGVDKIGLFLEDHGYNNYMVEIGGEVRTLGKKGNGENWKIGISTPLSDGLQKILSISGVSVATSGDYLNYFEKDGVRYSHLIDPTAGRPISHNLASVTVISGQCKIADAYATALNVMGPEIGYNFALEKKLPLFMIVRKENKFIEKWTPQFEDYIFERE